MTNRAHILGIPIDVVTEREAVVRIGSMLRGNTQHHIATPNPEMLVEAQKNDVFRVVLQNTAMNIPDGTGVVWAMRKFGSRAERVTGTDTMIELCSLEARVCPPERIFLLGAAPGVAERTAEVLKNKNRLMKDIGTFSGSPKEDDEAEILERINSHKPTILFVAFGAPAQELWIAKNLPKMPSVKVAIGVGGAFDFISGKRKRAPKWMQKIGCEWLWRVAIEPTRIGRIWRAVVVFPRMVRKES